MFPLSPQLCQRLLPLSLRRPLHCAPESGPQLSPVSAPTCPELAASWLSLLWGFPCLIPKWKAAAWDRRVPSTPVWPSLPPPCPTLAPAVFGGRGGFLHRMNPQTSPQESCTPASQHLALSGVFLVLPTVFGLSRWMVNPWSARSWPCTWRLGHRLGRSSCSLNTHGPTPAPSLPLLASRGASEDLSPRPSRCRLPEDAGVSPTGRSGM